MGMRYGEVVEIVNKVLSQYQTATIRQIYYRLVSPPYQYMENTKSMYTSFDMMMTRARERGEVDWHRITDNTRVVISPDNDPSDSIEDFMERLKYNVNTWWERYTIDMWENQDCRIRVLIEKDALAKLVADIVLPYQVKVIPGRGYNSFTQLMGQAEDLEDINISAWWRVTARMAR